MSLKELIPDMGIIRRATSSEIRERTKRTINSSWHSYDYDGRIGMIRMQYEARVNFKIDFRT